jgi:uncharacterized membrane protein
MCKGIKNLFFIKSARIIVGIAFILTMISLLALKEASWTKTFLVFGLIPFSLFIGGHFKRSGEIVKYQDFNQNFNQGDYEEEDETPIIDRIERTTTTTTKETLYFKKGIKYLE